MPSLLDPQLAMLTADMADVMQRAEQLVSPLPADARRRVPGRRSWSVDQILEHLVATNHSYLVRMRRVVDRVGQAPTLPTEAWQPTFIGRLMLRRMDPASSKHARSTQVNRPAPRVRADVLARFVDSMRQVLDLAERAEGHDLNHEMFTAPFAGKIRLNLGDGFAIIVVHARRHLAQIEATIPLVLEPVSA